MSYKNILLLMVIGICGLFILSDIKNKNLPLYAEKSIKSQSIKPTPTPTQIVLPKSKILKNNYYVIQSFNNCGPASLSMALSYYGINKTQEELGQDLRPYQNTDGDNDDKSVTLAELSNKVKDYNMVAYDRPNGDLKMLKQFLAHDIPIITKTWLSPNEDIGHYRVIKGYDDEKQVIIQDDSYQGQNLTFSYDEFNTLWEKYNFEYLVFVPKKQKELAESILGENKDKKKAWEKAKNNSESLLKKDPSNIYNRFNLSIALYYTGDYKSSVEEYEKIKDKLPFRTLWYQIEPILAYFKLGQYDSVLVLTDEILNNSNRAFSELYILRGKIYEKQGDNEAANYEYEQAAFYNTNLNTIHKVMKVD